MVGKKKTKVYSPWSAKMEYSFFGLMDPKWSPKLGKHHKKVIWAFFGVQNWSESRPRALFFLRRAKNAPDVLLFENWQISTSWLCTYVLWVKINISLCFHYILVMYSCTKHAIYCQMHPNFYFMKYQTSTPSGNCCW